LIVLNLLSLFILTSKSLNDLMDGLSAAASVIAVLQISAQLFDLCRTYYLNVKDARKDTQRL
jgi:hypothetical protein